MRTSIATVCSSGTPGQKMLAGARAGFHGVDIFAPDPMVSRFCRAPTKARQRSTAMAR